MYAAFVAVLGFGGGTVLQRFIHPPRGVFSLGYSFTYEVFSFLVVFGAAMIMSRIEVRSPGVYGLPIRGAFGKLFWQGCLIGLVEVSGLIGLIAAFGGYSFGGLALHGQDLLRWGILWAVFFVFVGLFEEFLFRGYTQYTLADSIGFWPGAIVLSCSFGAVHLGNPGEGWVGAAGVVMIGLVFAFALRRTGNLWLVVGRQAPGRRLVPALVGELRAKPGVSQDEDGQWPRLRLFRGRHAAPFRVVCGRQQLGRRRRGKGRCGRQSALRSPAPYRRPLLRRL